MASKQPKEFYVTKPKPFGNGARLEAFKKHINKEMVIMTKEYWDKVKKEKEVSEKQHRKNCKEYAEQVEIN